MLDTSRHQTSDMMIPRGEEEHKRMKRLYQDVGENETSVKCKECQMKRKTRGMNESYQVMALYYF